MITEQTLDLEALVERGAFVREFFERRIVVTHVSDIYAGESGHDWSLRDFVKMQDGSRHPESSVARFLPEIAHNLGAEFILAPRPIEFNAKVCREDDLDEIIPLGDEIALLRGFEADGLMNLRLNKTIAFSAAGCAITALWNEASPELSVAHMGRRSVINENRWFNNLPSPRNHESIVDALIENSRNHSRFAMRQMRALILFPIPKEVFVHRWDDPKYGEINQMRSKLVAEMWDLPEEEAFDLEGVIRAQLRRFGMLDENIETVWPLPGSRNTRQDDSTVRDMTLVTRLP